MSFSESRSDVIISDPTLHHIITKCYYKSDRYISYCHAKRFMTGYVVLFFNGDFVSKDIEIPFKAIDNPLI